jgi:RNA polymerase sigma-70 factor (ECF subfamily)
MVERARLAGSRLDSGSGAVETCGNLVSTPGTVGPAPVGPEAGAERHEAALLRRALRLTRHRQEAEDLVHDVYERLLLHAATLRPDTNVLVWMYTVLHNLFLDGCRRKTRGPRLVQDLEAVQPAADLTPEATPMWAAVSRDQLERAVAGLPPDYRVVFELHAADHSYDQIATQLGIPKNTVGSRLFRARAILKGALLQMIGPDRERP